MARSRFLLIGWLVAAIFVLVLTGCEIGVGSKSTSPTETVPQTPQTQGATVKAGEIYTDIDVAGLASMLEKKDFLLINVHIPYEGEIEGTDLFIAYNEIDQNLDKLPGDKGARLVVYCRSEGMSTTAARTLARLGYTNISSLKGGMIAWEQAGHPLIEND